MICLYAHGLYQLLSISEPGFGMGGSPHYPRVDYFVPYQSLDCA